MSSNVCSVYRDNLLLQGSRTLADLNAIDVYCKHAMNFNYGPNPEAPPVQQQVCNCPFGYGLNKDAYNFQSGPNFINLGQSLNFQAQQMAKGGFNGVPLQRPRYG